MKLKVKGYRVLIRPDPIERVSEGGIVIVASDKEERKLAAANVKGTVLDIGEIAFKAYDPDRTESDWYKWCKVGDHVIYNKYSAKYIEDPEDEEKQLAIVNDDDILAGEE